MGTPDYTVVGRPFVKDAKVLMTYPLPQQYHSTHPNYSSSHPLPCPWCSLSLCLVCPCTPWQVRLQVEEQTKDAKVIVFKKKRRKGYKRKIGFRREVTIFRVTDIEG